jgi:hypothetical protein
MFRWLMILACAVLWGAGGSATADLGAPATVTGSLTAAEALARVTAQTGYRIGGLGTLGSTRQDYDVIGPVPSAVRAIAAQSGLVLARTGPYDWLALPRPEIPPPPPPSQDLEALRLLVRGAHYPVRAGTNQLDEPLRLVVELDLEAPSDLDAAWLSGLDSTSLRLRCDEGESPALLEAVYRPAESPRMRLGQLASLPFGMPDPAATSAVLSGDLLLFEVLQPVGFQIAPDAVGSVVEAAELRLRVIAAETVGERWRVELGLRRPLVLGDPTPWLDAAVRTDRGTILRPRELLVREAATPRDAGQAPPDDDRPAEHLARIDFVVPVGERVARLDLVVAQRQRPWRRAPFEIAGIPLPAAPGRAEQ